MTSKRKLYKFVACQECRDDGKLQAEWKVGVLAGVPNRDKSMSIPVEVLVKRMRRAGLVAVGSAGDSAYGSLPSDKFLRESALQIAKEQGWTVKGSDVWAS